MFVFLETGHSYWRARNLEVGVGCTGAEMNVMMAEFRGMDGADRRRERSGEGGRQDIATTRLTSVDGGQDRDDGGDDALFAPFLSGGGAFFSGLLFGDDSCVLLPPSLHSNKIRHRWAVVDVLVS